MSELLDLVSTEQMTRPSAKLLLRHMLVSPTNESVKELARRMDLLVATTDKSLSPGTDEALRNVCMGAIDAFPSEVAAIRSGNENVVNKLIGWIMRETRGKTNAKQAKEMIEQLLRQ